MLLFNYIFICHRLSQDTQMPKRPSASNHQPHLVRGAQGPTSAPWGIFRPSSLLLLLGVHAALHAVPLRAALQISSAYTQLLHEIPMNT